MAKTLSTMVELGSKASDFSLFDPVTEKTVSFGQLRSDKGTVVMFICNHCPFVVHVEEELVALSKEYQAKGLAFVAISSNDVENYPADSPEKMKLKGYPFTYLYDETQEVAKSYDAACTPDFFVYNGDSELYYRGQFDDSRPGSDIEVTGSDLRSALDSLLALKPAPMEQKPSMGCNIKWKS